MQERVAQVSKDGPMGLGWTLDRDAIDAAIAVLEQPDSTPSRFLDAVQAIIPRTILGRSQISEGTNQFVRQRLKMHLLERNGGAEFIFRSDAKICLLEALYQQRNWLESQKRRNIPRGSAWNRVNSTLKDFIFRKHGEDWA